MTDSGVKMYDTTAFVCDEDLNWAYSGGRLLALERVFMIVLVAGANMKGDVWL